jgi:hypothetical protein
LAVEPEEEEEKFHNLHIQLIKHVSLIILITLFVQNCRN